MDIHEKQEKQISKGNFIYYNRPDKKKTRNVLRTGKYNDLDEAESFMQLGREWSRLVTLTSTLLDDHFMSLFSLPFWS